MVAELLKADANDEERVRQRQERHDRMVAELLKDYYATHGASEAFFIERTVAGLNTDAEPPLASVANNVADDVADVADVADDVANVANDVADVADIADVADVADAESPLANVADVADVADFADVADAMKNDDVELLPANETDGEDDVADDGSVPYVHPYVWKCVDDGDEKGCGVVRKVNTPSQVQLHRQSKLHAKLIALGSPDIGKGIRADGWHCIDDGDKFGCGAVLSMENEKWCVYAYNHLMSPSHAKRITR
jgi:hypothetical protein